MQTTKILITLTAIAALSACGNVGNAVRTMQGDNADNAANFTAANVDGFWKTNGGGIFVKVGKTDYWVSSTLQLQLGHLTRTLTYSTGLPTTGGKQVYVLKQSGDYTVGDSIDYSYRSLTLTHLTTTGTALTDEAALDLRSTQACSSSSWLTGQALDLSASACNSIAFRQGLQINAVSSDHSGAFLKIAQCTGKSCAEDTFGYISTNP